MSRLITLIREDDHSIFTQVLYWRKGRSPRHSDDVAPFTMLQDLIVLPPFFINIFLDPITYVRVGSLMFRKIFVGTELPVYRFHSLHT